MRKLLLALSIFSLPALAQIQVFQFDGTTEHAVNSFFSVGSTAPGDTLETRFRVRNTGAGPAAFNHLALAGEGFQLVQASVPTLPYTIAPGNYAEFRVDFTPTRIDTFPALMAVNGVDIRLQGTGVAGASLALSVSGTMLASSSTIPFGSVTVGSSSVQTFTLSNPGSTGLTVQSITVSGAGFSCIAGCGGPVQLAAGQSASFMIQFQPQTAQPAQGTLAVDGRSFNLTGLGLAPPLATFAPTISMDLASSSGASAQQNSLSVALGSPSPVGGSGTLAMQFTPSVAGVTDDATVQFLSGKPRLATVNFLQGASAGTFNGKPNIVFSTGATAGTITFTLTLEDGTQAGQTKLTVAPAAVNLDTATGLRKAGELDISLTGFDNTYSASQLAFTFYDTKGAVVQPGAIPVNVASAFTQYFSTSQVGGMFALLAKFPVAGDTTQIMSVDIQITNSAGTVTAEKVAIAGSTPPQVVPTSN